MQDFISFSATHEGVLDWFDAADSEGNIVVRTMGSSFPKRPSAVTAWLKKSLDASQQQPFFVMPLLAHDFRVPCELVREKTAPDPSWTEVYVRIPLAAFFNLPNERPLEELAQMREFFEWARAKSESLRRPFFESPRLQWYRQGREYGLEWAGMSQTPSGLPAVDEPTTRQWTQELEAWREKPWFNAWYDRNIAGMKKLRIGPHCWAGMGYFRNSYQLFDEQRAAGIIVDKPKASSGKPGM